MKTLLKSETRDKVLGANRRLHALEGSTYMERHTEQTHFHQARILHLALDRLERLLGKLSRAGGTGAVRILDLGCGTGYLFLPLLERGFHMTGVDLSGEMIRALEDRIPARYRARTRLSAVGAATFAERDSGIYDAVTLSGVLHHLYDYPAVVRAYCRKLAPGGAFLVFFEPLKQAVASRWRFACHRGLATVDEALYRARMRRRGIPLLEDESLWADYQRRFGGIDPQVLKDVLLGEGLEVAVLKKHCARRSGLLAFLADRVLRTQNTFYLLAVKKT